MKKSLLFLFFASLGINTLFAQNTTEKVNQTIKTINNTGKAIKSLGGLFDKKNRKTDSLRKQERVEKPVVNKESATTVASYVEPIDKNFVAKIVFGKQKNELDILWKASSDEKIEEEIVSQLLSSDGYYHTSIGEIIEFEEGNIKNATAILITYNYLKDGRGKLRKNDGRAASVGIGFANFVKDEADKWQLLNLNKLAGRIGSMGELPSYEHIKFGNSLSTISFTDGYGMGGQSETRQLFYALGSTYLGKCIFDLTVEESYDGGFSNKGSYEITRSYKVLANNINADYPNILVSEIKNKKPQPNTLYAFSKDKSAYAKITNTSTNKIGLKSANQHVPQKKAPQRKSTTPISSKPSPNPVKSKPKVKTASTNENTILQ